MDFRRVRSKNSLFTIQCSSFALDLYDDMAASSYGSPIYANPFFPTTLTSPDSGLLSRQYGIYHRQKHEDQH